MSNTIKVVPGKRKDRSPKVDSGRNSPELVHVVKGDLCDEQLYARKEFWKVVNELQVMYQVSRFDAIGICISEFAALNLNCEENGIVENVALFPIASWQAGEIPSKRRK